MTRWNQQVIVGERTKFNSRQSIEGVTSIFHRDTSID